MLPQDLTAYQYREKADVMKKDLIQLPIRFGSYEYFDSMPRPPASPGASRPGVRLPILALIRFSAQEQIHEQVRMQPLETS